LFLTQSNGGVCSADQVIAAPVWRLDDLGRVVVMLIRVSCIADYRQHCLPFDIACSQSHDMPEGNLSRFEPSFVCLRINTKRECNNIVGVHVAHLFLWNFQILLKFKVAIVDYYFVYFTFFS
jgi:hypothetical protein